MPLLPAELWYLPSMHCIKKIGVEGRGEILHRANCRITHIIWCESPPLPPESDTDHNGQNSSQDFLLTCSLSFNMLNRIIKFRIIWCTWLRWRWEIWLPVTSLRMNSTQGCTVNLANSIIIVREYCLLGIRSWWLNLSVYCPHKTNNALS